MTAAICSTVEPTPAREVLFVLIFTRRYRDQRDEDAGLQIDDNSEIAGCEDSDWSLSTNGKPLPRQIRRFPNALVSS